MKTETERKVSAIMGMYDELDQRKYVGDYTAIVHLDEFDEAVASADLTDKQSEVVQLFKKGYNTNDVAEIIVLAHNTVSEIKKRAIAKIAKQYRNGEF